MDITNDFTVLFDNFDLNSIPYVYFVRRNPNDEADIKITSHDVVRREGAIVTSVRHKNKIIPIEGYIIAPTRTSFEEAFDTLKFKTSGVEKGLSIIQAGSTRRYTATKENLILDHIEEGKARVNIAFRCSQPYGVDTTLTTDTFTAYDSPYGIPHTFQGTAVIRPVFTITVDALTGGTTKHIGVGNSTTGQQVQITRTWTTGDVVRFDVDQHKVFVNSTLSDYSGVFPEFSPDRSSAYTYDNLTTRTLLVELSYVRQYL